ncbi:MAG: hypothetical protein FJ038_06930 [Chloroflexi bacterium]|nr:hypothetical protein [Chloroflexota bacterium]
MLRRIAGWLLALFIGAAVAGCGQAGGSSATPSPTPSASLSAPTPTISAGPTAARTITLADNGRSVTLAVGDRFQLMLGTDFDWTLMPVDLLVITRLPDGTLPPGVQGSYEAVAPGTVKMSAVGDPPCRKVTPPCGAPSILFEVTLVVR